MRSRFLQAIGLGVVIAASMLIGGVLAVNVGDEASAPPTAADSAAPTTSISLAGTPAPAPPDSVAVAAIEDLPGLIEGVGASVVRIQTAASSDGFGSQGVGSGVVIDLEGHILTNYHVVEGAATVEVELADGFVATATVLGTDPGNDLAVIRAAVQPQRLQPATFGDSDAVRVGEPVFAIGNPFSLDFSVTAGIVSAIERERQALNGRPIRSVIQTDAAVNPGNSGGPLFNARGEVIGINTSIENPTGQGVFVGIGFAVPSNTALRFIPQLIDGQSVAHPQLGIAGADLNEFVADGLDLDITSGVYVTSVGPGSAAAAAGLRAPTLTGLGSGLARGGDVIVAINGEPIESISALAIAIDQHDVDDVVSLTVIRDGETVEVEATLQPWQTA